MSIGRFLLLAAAGTLISWITWIMVITRLDPISGGPFAVTLFFFSLLFALVGTGTLLGYGARHLLENNTLPFQQMATAARQALNVSLLVILLLGLQSGRILNPWTGILSIALAIGVEAFFIAGQSRRYTDVRR